MLFSFCVPEEVVMQLLILYEPYLAYLSFIMSIFQTVIYLFETYKIIKFFRI